MASSHDHKTYEMREDLDQAGKIDDPLIANPATQAVPLPGSESSADESKTAGSDN